MQTYERWIDQIIREAKEEGAFDDIKDKAIDNSDYFNVFLPYF